MPFSISRPCGTSSWKNSALSNDTQELAYRLSSLVKQKSVTRNDLKGRERDCGKILAYPSSSTDSLQ